MLISHIAGNGSTFDVAYQCGCGNKGTLKIASKPNMLVWCGQKRCYPCYELTREQALGAIVDSIVLDIPVNLELPMVIPF